GRPVPRLVGWNRYWLIWNVVLWDQSTSPVTEHQCLRPILPTFCERAGSQAWSARIIFLVRNESVRGNLRCDWPITSACQNPQLPLRARWSIELLDSVAGRLHCRPAKSVGHSEFRCRYSMKVSTNFINNTSMAIAVD